MAGQPGSKEYYQSTTPQQRQKDYQHQIQAVINQGGSKADVPIEAYFTPAETTYIQHLAVENLKPWQQSVKDKFPSYASYFGNPEIAQILKDSVDNKWLPAELESHLHASQWWQAHSPAQRSWYLLNNTDPAAAHQSVTQQFDTTHRLNAMLGLGLTAGQMMTLSIESLSQGWTDQQLNEQMIQTSKAPVNAGTMGATRDQLKATANDYLLPISDHSLDNWTKRIAAGTATPDVFKDQMSRTAQSRYQDPGIKDALQRGMTIREFADPYVQFAAQTLGRNPNDIDLLQPKWGRSLDFVDSAGKRRAMTMDEWQQHIKMDPTYGYDSSKNGIAEASQMVNQLRQQFGFA